MCPRYPPVAKRQCRCDVTVRTRCHENGRGGNGYGPSRYPSHTSAEAITALTDPAPTIVPTAIPRRVRNQVEIIFMAGGYTPARQTPQAKRDAAALVKPPADNSSALAPAPSRADPANSARDGMMSARFSTATTAV